MREDSNAAHDRFDGVGIDNALFHTGYEERGFAALELVIKVDEKGEEGGLAGIGRRGIVLVFVCYRINAWGWPCTIWAAEKG